MAFFLQVTAGTLLGDGWTGSKGDSISIHQFREGLCRILDDFTGLMSIDPNVPQHNEYGPKIFPNFIIRRNSGRRVIPPAFPRLLTTNQDLIAASVPIFSNIKAIGRQYVGYFYAAPAQLQITASGHYVPINTSTGQGGAPLLRLTTVWVSEQFAMQAVSIIIMAQNFLELSREVVPLLVGPLTEANSENTAEQQDEGGHTQH